MKGCADMNKKMWLKGYREASKDDRTMGHKYILRKYELMVKESGIDKDFWNGYEDYMDFLLIE